MSILMAYSTKGCYLEPVFFLVTSMVIVLCLLSAVGAKLGRYFREFVSSGSFVNRLSGSYFNIFSSFFVSCSFEDLTAVCGLISCYPGLPFRATTTGGYFFSVARFALCTVAIFTGFVFIVLIDWFSLIACVTEFRGHLASFKQIKVPYLSLCWTPITAVTLQIRDLISYYNYLIWSDKVTLKQLASCRYYTTKGGSL